MKHHIFLLFTLDQKKNEIRPYLKMKPSNLCRKEKKTMIGSFLLFSNTY